MNIPQIISRSRINKTSGSSYWKEPGDLNSVAWYATAITPITRQIQLITVIDSGLLFMIRH
jgi:hypothetical protein